jgi:FHA domain
VIKCPNCGMDNVDGSLFCDGCAWDISMVESIPGEPAPAGAPAAAAPAGSRVSGMAAAAPAGSRVSGMAASASGLAAAPASGVAMEATIPVEGDMDMSGSMSVEASVADPAMGDAPMGDAPMGDMAMADAPPADVGDIQLDLSAAPGVGETPAAESPPSVAPMMDAPPGSAAGLMDAPPPSGAGLVPDKIPTGMKQATGMLAAAVAPAGPPGAAAQTVVRLFPAAMAKLVVVKGQKTGSEFPIYEGQNIIGRFDEAPVDIDLTDQEPADNPRASRQHASVIWENGGLVVEDLNSSNGTFVNRNRVNPGEKKPIRNGDYIQTGQVLLQVKS